MIDTKICHCFTLSKLNAVNHQAKNHLITKPFESSTNRTPYCAFQYNNFSLFWNA